MSARQEAYIPTSQRLQQGANARRDNIAAWRANEQQRAMADLFAHGVFPVPIYDSPDAQLPRLQTLLPVAAALVLLNAACGSQPPTETPRAAQVEQLQGRPGPIVAMEPGAAATVQANEARLAATAFADRQTAATAVAKTKQEATATAIAGTQATATTGENKVYIPIVTNQGPMNPTAEPTRTPEVVTQEKLVAQIDTIIDKIKNPDPALLDKYKVDRRLLEMDQTIIINGGVPEELKRSSGKEYTSDSLKGMQDKIKDGVDPKELQKFIKLTYDQMSKRGLGDAGEYTMLATDAARIDPDHEFIGFYADGNQSRVKPEYKDKAAYVGSMVKQKAAFETIKLWYMVKEITH